MPNCKTFVQMEALLRKTMELPGRRISEIAAAIGIKPNTLYKWRTGRTHLSPQKADALLMYFVQNEPGRLELAQAIIE